MAKKVVRFNCMKNTMVVAFRVSKMNKSQWVVLNFMKSKFELFPDDILRKVRDKLADKNYQKKTSVERLSGNGKGCL